MTVKQLMSRLQHALDNQTIQDSDTIRVNGYRITYAWAHEEAVHLGDDWPCEDEGIELEGPS